MRLKSFRKYRWVNLLAPVSDCFNTTMCVHPKRFTTSRVNTTSTLSKPHSKYHTFIFLFFSSNMVQNDWSPLSMWLCVYIIKIFVGVPFHVSNSCLIFTVGYKQLLSHKTSPKKKWHSYVHINKKLCIKKGHGSTETAYAQTHIVNTHDSVDESIYIYTSNIWVVSFINILLFHSDQTNIKRDRTKPKKSVLFKVFATVI